MSVYVQLVVGIEAYLLESLVNDVWMLEMIVREEIKLIEEVSDVYAAERIHLRKWKDTWKSVHKLTGFRIDRTGFLT